MQYYIGAFKNYVNFKGRATRTQYWMFILINAILSFAAGFIDGLIFGDVFILSFVYNLAVLLPWLAISIRRMHDSDRSGFWILVSLIPLIGWIWYLILACQPSSDGENRFGFIEE